MFTKPLRSLLCLAAIATATLAFPVQAQTSAAVSVKDFDVFVDLPTALAFIKLPMGWKFIGKLDADQLRHLPAGTLTSLLPPEDVSTRLAGEPQRLGKGKS